MFSPFKTILYSHSDPSGHTPYFVEVWNRCFQLAPWRLWCLRWTVRRSSNPLRRSSKSFFNV